MNKFYKAILFCGLLTGFTSTAVCASTELDFVIENGVIETSGGWVRW